ALPASPRRGVWNGDHKGRDGINPSSSLRDCHAPPASPRRGVWAGDHKGRDGINPSSSLRDRHAPPASPRRGVDVGLVPSRPLWSPSPRGSHASHPLAPCPTAWNIKGERKMIYFQR